MSATRSRDNSVKRKNVQVVVRVRPLSESERFSGNKNIVSCDFGGKTVSLKNVNASDSLRFIQGQKCLDLMIKFLAQNPPNWKFMRAF
uniref:Kinesin motor domain-containing protein n=1 Tax=Meloidogyne enterolobii TaxID=390850 RepID=A0A6V7YAN6_MELEN|nr:unnamed protein product [Meloidogyne enterolobii]